MKVSDINGLLQKPVAPILGLLQVNKWATLWYNNLLFWATGRSEYCENQEPLAQGLLSINNALLWGMVAFSSGGLACQVCIVAHHMSEDVCFFTRLALRKTLAYTYSSSPYLHVSAFGLVPSG